MARLQTSRFGDSIMSDLKGQGRMWSYGDRFVCGMAGSFGWTVLNSVEPERDEILHFVRAHLALPLRFCGFPLDSVNHALLSLRSFRFSSLPSRSFLFLLVGSP